MIYRGVLFNFSDPGALPECNKKVAEHFVKILVRKTMKISVFGKNVFE